MEREPSPEFGWLQRVADQDSQPEYNFRWIAIDGAQIASAVRPQDAIVSADDRLDRLFA